jgi:hypothetical protein
MKAISTINTLYLMTLHAPLESPQIISRELKIYNVRAGGWIRGPHIQGDVISPSADWLHVMPNGTKRLDVRLSIRGDDGSWIFMVYGGRIATTEQLAQKRLPIGLPRQEASYFFITPVFETESPKYGWLNDIVCIGKNVANREEGEDDFVTYEIFAVT